MCDEGQANHLH
jgi:bZIP transcription factor